MTMNFLRLKRNKLYVAQLSDRQKVSFKDLSEILAYARHDPLRMKRKSTQDRLEAENPAATCQLLLCSNDYAQSFERKLGLDLIHQFFSTVASLCSILLGVRTLLLDLLCSFSAK